MEMEIKYIVWMTIPGNNWVFPSLGGIARKPWPISTERCSTDLTDLIDIFPVERPYEVKKKSIISAVLSTNASINSIYHQIFIGKYYAPRSFLVTQFMKKMIFCVNILLQNLCL